jgi:HEAT repeat protein
LLQILEDRRQVGVLKRLLGGDFRHSGILRRNTIQIALRWLRVAGEPQVEAALLVALETDPYFEVRAAAADLLGEAGKPSERIESALVNALSDRSRRVVARAIRALGAVGRDPGLIRLLRNFYHHPDWQVRHEVVLALQSLLRRGVLSPSEMAGEAEQVLATSPNFNPEFPLKESLSELAELADSPADASEAPDAFRAGGG